MAPKSEQQSLEEEARASSFAFSGGLLPQGVWCMATQSCVRDTFPSAGTEEDCLGHGPHKTPPYGGEQRLCGDAV